MRLSVRCLIDSGEGFDFVAIGRRQEDSRSGGDDAVATVVFGLIECIVGELQEQIDVVGGLVESGDANGNG